MTGKSGSAFTAEFVDLTFSIYDSYAFVTSHIDYYRVPGAPRATEIVLRADNPNKSEDYLKSIFMNGRGLREGVDYTYDREKKEIRISADPSQPVLNINIMTKLIPSENDQSGLRKICNDYVASGNDGGFARITPFLAGGDYAIGYRVILNAESLRAPFLEAAGRKTLSGPKPDGRHMAVFEQHKPTPVSQFKTRAGQAPAP